MKILRKISIALLTLLAAGPAERASAQGLMVCTATAVPAPVQAQGLAEQVGDVILLCFATIGSPPTPNFTTTASLTLNTDIANDVDFGAGADVSDAVLVVNENHCGSPS